jgi:anti-sigma factor RsiW
MTLTCLELDGLIDLYLDGNLSQDQLAAFHRHLGQCPDCGGYLYSYRKVVSLLKEERRAYE